MRPPRQFWFEPGRATVNDGGALVWEVRKWRPDHLRVEDRLASRADHS